MHQQGIHYAFTRKLSDDERMTELNANIARENHRLATKRPEILEEKLERYEIRIVRPGVGLNTEQHPGTMVEACGLAIQHTLEGIKYRLTHDLSFSITGKDASVNSRCDMEAYPEMVYGFCRSRSIHFRVALIKRRLPNKKILNSKYDFADAYKRMAHKTSLTI